MQVLIAVDPTDPGDLEQGAALLAQLATQAARRAAPETVGVRRTQVAAPAPADASMTTPREDQMFDGALQLLYDDGTPREGSLRFLEQALRYEPGTGYTIPEIAADLGVEPPDARAFRRNLGRALHWIARDELPGLPNFFEHSRLGGAWRYEVVAGVREAAVRRGLI